jgi:hypothetical protein
MNFNQSGGGFLGLANDIGEDLYNIGNFDKPLIETEIVEDSSSFEDRLKRLQTDRETIAIPQTNDKIDFNSSLFLYPNLRFGSYKGSPRKSRRRSITPILFRVNSSIVKIVFLFQNSLYEYNMLYIFHKMYILNNLNIIGHNSNMTKFLKLTNMILNTKHINRYTIIIK